MFTVCVFPAVNKSLTFPALDSNYMQPLKSSVAAALATSVKYTHRERVVERERVINKQGGPLMAGGKRTREFDF